ncbi:Benzoylformate decarboxylase [Pigmentiphaga humi]|uniref:Benzoylformate decarboxylase n=1 Tax=Pigmentiphaga humi TaxID=2478468 RepID=A0A3P4B456_9BURK|nr:thiamine pyrophosphate-dependent enzyme [Pigmentiphaga humi]VCU70418.1 Benzoylformate decarboxylase [Pigmentiphaga humi]
MKAYVDGGEGLLEAFRNLGVDYIFSSPGSEWAPVWEAVARQRHENLPGPRYMDLWHETLAVGMATGYALMTHRPQAVLLHAGGGLLQGTCAIQGAQLSGAPMVIFSSESNSYGERESVDPGSQWYRNLSIVGGVHGLVQPIVKWANQVPGIETMYEMVLRTGEMSMRAPTGPTYLGIPVEVLLEPWESPAHPRKVPAPARKVSPPDELDAVARMLAEARQPVVLTESAGRSPGGMEALVRLCEQLAIPVIEPQSAVCTNFPRSHELHLGGSADDFMGSADLVLLVNCRAPWYPPSRKPTGARTVVLDEVPQRPHIVYQVLHADVYLEGDVPATLDGLLAAVQRVGFDAALVRERRARHHATHARQHDRADQAERQALERSDAIDPVLVTRLLRETCAPETVFVDETITHSRLVQQHLRCDRPASYHYVQGGLGQGIAVALGVKLAAGGRPVVLTVGDGSFLYNPIVQSLGASRDQNLPLLIVIYNNGKYLSMQYNHRRYYPDGVAAETGSGLGSDLSTQPDLASLAGPFGMHGETVRTPDRLPQALADAAAAVAAGRTAILNVIVAK